MKSSLQITYFLKKEKIKTQLRFSAKMSFKMQTNLERKSSYEGQQTGYVPMIKDEKFIENLRKIVKDYLDIVSFF